MRSFEEDKQQTVVEALEGDVLEKLVNHKFVLHPLLRINVLVPIAQLEVSKLL